MAPGDLNLKKSWHPGLMKNQQKVWEKEQEALLERKKIKERQDEIAKERELAELRALQRKKGENTIVDRVDWMYDTSGVGDGGKLVTNESEEYLLGKKRVDDLITSGKSNGDRFPEKARGFDKIEEGYKLSQKDQMTISREDPMMKIQQQRMKKLEELRIEKKLKERKEKSKGRPRSHRPHSERDRSRERRPRNAEDKESSFHRYNDDYKDRDRYGPRESREDREQRHRESRTRESLRDRYVESRDYRDSYYEDRR